jgi:hypothetical protein
MRFTALVLCSLTVWGLIGLALIGADPVKADAIPNQYVGRYLFGDGKGYNCSLNLEKNGNFQYSLSGCLGTYHKKNGEFEVRDGKVILKPSTPNPWFGRHSISTEYYPVPWDGRMYLIPQSQMLGFCIKVNKGWEPRTQFFGEFYLLDKDWEKPVTGDPQLPKEFMKILDPKPVRGKITDLNGKQEAWVDLGADAKMETGKKLYVRGEGMFSLTTLEIVQVEKNKSRVKLEVQTDRVRVGDPVSSSLRK